MGKGLGYGRFGAALLAGTAMLVAGCHKDGASAGGGAGPAGDSVKVGVLHSLTGTMAISEVTVKNAEHAGHRRDQRVGRGDGQEDRGGRRGRRLRSRPSSRRRRRS